jgi:TIR domain
MEREQQAYLVQLLLRIPDIENPFTRTSLLTSIPNRLSLARDHTNTENDISRLVDQLSVTRLPNGQWALLVFIDNALYRLEGTMTGEELAELRGQLAAQDQLSAKQTDSSRPNTQTQPSQTPSPVKTADTPIAIFYCYAPEDERYYKELDKQLAVMKRNKVITTCGLDILAGDVTKEETEKALQAADIVLLLVSPGLMASDRLYEEQVEPALVQRQAGKRVIPILVRDTAEWEHSEFGGLEPLPKERKPVQAWKHPDEAFKLIAQGIRKVVDDLRSSRSNSSHAK